MLTGPLIIATVSLLAVLSYRRSRLEQKIYKNVSLTDWLSLFVYPLALYLGWFFLVKSILSRPKLEIFFLDDFDLFAINTLFLVYGFVGIAIHFTSKVLWRYLKGSDHNLAYRVNEMFHGKLSHYLSFLSGLLIIFMLFLLEINHPLVLPAKSLTLFLFAFLGVVMGLSVKRTIFYTSSWFGGYNRPLFFLVLVLAGLVNFLKKIYGLKFSFYPVGLFVFSLFLSFLFAFILGEILIFTRLNRKKRLRILAKIFSLSFPD